jgi:hypothetical protein
MKYSSYHETLKPYIECDRRLSETGRGPQAQIRDIYRVPIQELIVGNNKFRAQK